MTFADPGDEDLKQLAYLLVAAGELAVQLGVGELTNTEADLDVAQAILDTGELDAERTYELEALGVVFGQVLISRVDGLDWTLIDDEYGSRTALRYRNTDLCINVLSSISKRVEDGEEIDLHELLDGFVSVIDRALLEMGGTA